ncbi:hypothetical protein B0H14DRAFT_2732816 [Mycena olivaceomarginata]|nr:hypothetical protein B0H14DRAFT_2732816 [Mycena olivaceomarginata]
MIFGRITAVDGKLCFLCEDETIEHEIARIGCCVHCSPPVKLTHILFDHTIKAEDQPCGLCLRPAPQCKFVLKGSSPVDIQVDGRKSNCPGYSRFSYQTASVSETKNLSSNVPVLCPTSSCSAVIWKYVLHRHFKECHPGLPQSVYNVHAISATEKRLLKVLWDNRHTKTQRKSRKSKQKKGIGWDASEWYKTSWALRINDNGVDESGTDEVVEAVLEGETSCDARGNSAGVLPDLPESDDEDLHLHLASPRSTTSSFTAENNKDIIMEEAILPSTAHVKRRNFVMKLGVCECGRPVEDHEKNDNEAIRCAGKGCETRGWIFQICNLKSTTDRLHVQFHLACVDLRPDWKCHAYTWKRDQMN